METAALRTPIITLIHITRTRAKQILSPCVIPLQVASLEGLDFNPIQPNVGTNDKNLMLKLSHENNQY